MFDKIPLAVSKLWDTFGYRLSGKLDKPVLLTQDETVPGTVTFHVAVSTETIEPVSEFSLSKLPGTLWLYSHGAQVFEPWRNNGVGGLLNEFRERLAEEVGAWGLLAFVRGDNDVQRKVLKRNGWILLGTFITKDDDYTQQAWVHLTPNKFVRVQ